MAISRWSANALGTRPLTRSSAAPALSATASCQTCGGAMSAEGCPTCGVANVPSRITSSPYVYAIGRVEPRYPRISVEKELAQVARRMNTGRMTDSALLETVLSADENRYLVRQLCWVFTVQDQETFILLPRDPGDWDLLVETLRPEPQATDLSVVIGVRGGNAPVNMCNGLVVPVVTFDHLYTFDRDTLIGAIPRPPEASLSEENAREFESVALELFNRTMHMADNRGATDAHRALNYLLVRDPTIYVKVAEELASARP
jgi:PatG Domain